MFEMLLNERDFFLSFSLILVPGLVDMFLFFC